MHSRYERRLTDPAVGGRTTTIELTVRRFFCDAAECGRTTFVEQVTGLTQRHAPYRARTCRTPGELPFRPPGQDHVMVVGSLYLALAEAFGWLAWHARSDV